MTTGRDEPESILLSEARLLAGDAPLSEGVTLRTVITESDVRAMSSMQDGVLADPVSEKMADALLHQLSLRGDTHLCVAEAAGLIVCAGRLEPVAGTDFAGIWAARHGPNGAAAASIGP